MPCIRYVRVDIVDRSRFIGQLCISSSSQILPCLCTIVHQAKKACLRHASCLTKGHSLPKTVHSIGSIVWYCKHSVQYNTVLEKRQAQNKARDAISELALITSPICPFHGAKWTHMVPAEDVSRHFACKCCGPTDHKESLASYAHYEGCKNM